MRSPPHVFLMLFVRAGNVCLAAWEVSGRGMGGGVVVNVYPIQAMITSTAATSANAES